MLLAAPAANAQSLLGRLGNAVSKKVSEKISEKVTEKVTEKVNDKIEEKTGINVDNMKQMSEASQMPVPDSKETLQPRRSSSFGWSGTVTPSTASFPIPLMNEFPAVPSASQLANPTEEAQIAYYQAVKAVTLRAEELNADTTCEDNFTEKWRAEAEKALQDAYGITAAEMEHMGGTRTEESNRTYWDQLHPIDDWTKGDVAYRVARYQALSDAVEQLWGNIPEHKRDAFFQLVKYPVQGAAQMNFKLLCPERCVEAYDSIASLTRIYNKVCAGGKWDGIMDMHPRDLPVYSKVKPEQLPVYPDGPRWEDREIKDMRFVSDGDSVTLEVRLLPTHPVNKKLSFSIAVDGGKAEVREYQTYDRSEEWKQNVLHGYAVRTVTLPLDKSRREHQITFKPLDEGVVLKHILKK